MRHILLLSILLFSMAVKGVSQTVKMDTIVGQVLDAKNQALEDVTIFSSKGSYPIGATDAFGSFKVVIPNGASLKFSRVNYQSIIVKPVIGTSVHIQLQFEKGKGDMEQVVVTGFKRGTRELSTGSTTTLSQKDIQDVPAANVASLLQGKVAGLNIQNFSGQPGSMVSISLNGLNGVSVQGSGNNAFLTPTSPLFVIDGVQTDANSDFSYGVNSAGPGMSPLAMIPVEDIESIDVLKDAAATGLYGSRGAYGVIVITTKRGKSKVPVITFQNKYFYSAVPKLREVIGGKDERMLRINEILQNDTSYREALTLINSNPILADSLNGYYNNSTNWQDIFYHSEQNYTSNLSVNGGDDKFNYKTNLGYYREMGIIENTGLTRYTLNSNATYMPNEKFKLFVTLNTGIASKQNGSGIGLLQTGVATSAASSSLYPGPSRYSANNSALIASSVKDQSQTVQIMPSIDLTVEPIKNLRFNSNTNFNFNSNIQNSFQPGYTNGNQALVVSYNDRKYYLYNRNMITYNHVVQDVHTFSIYVFNELTKTNYKANEFNIKGAASDFIQGPTGYNFYGSSNGTLNLIDSKTASFGGDVSYNYKRKYILEFQYLTSGSSTNGPSVGFQKTPIYSARWNFNRESWFDNAQWLDYGSLRGSWGRTMIPQGDIYSVYGSYIGGSTFNGSQTVDISSTYIPNNNFKPTINTNLNIGFEMGFLKNRFNFTYEFYYKQIDNQSRAIQLPNISGFQYINSNDISSVNYGHNITINIRPLSESSPVTWSINMNAGINRDVLTKLPNNLRQMYATQSDDPLQLPILYRIGRNALTTLVYNTEGVYKTDAEVPLNPFTGLPLQIKQPGGSAYVYARAGMPKWTDVNGDYVIDENDLQPLGNPIPKITGGINSNLQYKQWMFSTSISFTLLRDVINTSLAYRLQQYGDPYANSAIYPISDLDYYKTYGQNAKYPNPFDYLNSGTVQPFRYNQTLFMEDGSYWKLNSATVAYSLEPKIAARFHMSQVRFYLTGSNLLILSKYSGSSPENVSTLGRDTPDGYPNPRVYTLGLDVRF